jgi:hypothetical protein
MVFGDADVGLTTCWRPNRADPNDPLHHYIISRVAYPNEPANCWSDTADCGTAQVDIGDYRPDISPKAAEFEQQARHSAGDNLGMADGHAKWYRSNQITWDLFFGDHSP